MGGEVTPKLKRLVARYETAIARSSAHLRKRPSGRDEYAFNRWLRHDYFVVSLLNQAKDALVREVVTEAKGAAPDAGEEGKK